jgi:hypothetical protein
MACSATVPPSRLARVLPLALAACRPGTSPVTPPADAAKPNPAAQPVTSDPPPPPISTPPPTASPPSPAGPATAASPSTTGTASTAATSTTSPSTASTAAPPTTASPSTTSPSTASTAAPPTTTGASTSTASSSTTTSSAPCEPLDRGVLRRRHPFLGRTLAQLEDRGGHLVCGSGLVWQLRFGTLCGDLASFHELVTVELRAGKVRRVWTRERYNSGWCGGF